MKQPVSFLKREYAPVAELTKGWIASLLVVSTLGIGACDKGCEATCRKVLSCDDLETNELTIGECNAECVRQTDYYELAEDEAGADALAAHKKCLNQSTCDEIVDGACYESTLYGF